MHKSRKHNPHSLEDFKDEVTHKCAHTHPEQESEDNSWLLEESEATVGDELLNEGEDLVEAIVKQLASLLLKLDCIYNVPNKCVDEIVEQLQFIVSSASTSVIQNIVSTTLQNHGCTVNEIVVADLAKRICQLNPISVAFSKDGPLSTAYKRNVYLKEQFSITQPVEYILMMKKHFSIFQFCSPCLNFSKIVRSRKVF